MRNNRHTAHRVKRSSATIKSPAMAFTIAVLVAVGISSCVSGKERLKEREGVSAVPFQVAPELCCVRRLAVLNFFEHGADEGSGKPHVCHITGLNFAPGSVAEGSGELVANQFRYHLSERGFIVVDPETTGKAVSEASEGERPKYSVDLAARVGRELEADAVIIGSVMRFEDRIGGKIAVGKPASVAFSVAVVDPLASRIIWKAKFEKTQKALFDNVLDYKTFFKGGMVWQRADQLSDLGVVNTLDQMPFKAEK